MQKVIVDEIMFIQAFSRDEVFSDLSSESAHLDLETGEVLWVFDDDDDAETYAGIDPEENGALRNQFGDRWRQAPIIICVVIGEP